MGGPRPATARIQELPGRLRARAGLQEQLILRGRQAVGQRGLAGPVNADAVALGAAVGRGVLFIDVEGDAPPFQGLRQAQAAQAGAGDGDVEGEGVMGIPVGVDGDSVGPAAGITVLLLSLKIARNGQISHSSVHRAHRRRRRAGADRAARRRRSGQPHRLGSREYDWHSHVRGQLFCVESGLVHVRTSHGSWLPPPQRAGWIPPGSAIGPASAARPAAGASSSRRRLRGAAGAALVIGISELMQALVRRAVTWTDRRELAPPEARIADVLLDEIQRAPREPLHLPMPSDPRLARIARAVYERPDDPRSLEDWARWGAVSPRTLRRLMAAETGMSFGRWRQQAGLIHALERLAQGEAVATVADALGYASPSGFIAMFRRAFGASPGRYFEQRQE